MPGDYFDILQRSLKETDGQIMADGDVPKWNAGAQRFDFAASLDPALGGTILGALTITPSSGGLNLNRDGASALFTISAYGFSGTNFFPSFVNRAARGTMAAPLRTKLGDQLMRIGGIGARAADDVSPATFAGASKVSMDFYASEDWTTAANGSHIIFATTPSGSTTLTVAGRFSADQSFTVTGKLGLTGINLPTHYIEQNASSSTTASAININHTFTTGGALATTYPTFLFHVNNNSTDGSATGLVSGLLYRNYVGTGGLAVVGNNRAGGSELIVGGSGAAANESCSLFAVLRYDLGAGFTQTALPTGWAWGTDRNLHTAVGLQMQMVVGDSSFVNNYNNGSPVKGSYGHVVTTHRADGGGRTATHQAAATFPLDIAYYATGYSDNGSVAVGWTRGFFAGYDAAAPGPWQAGDAKIATGFEANKITTRGFFASAKYAGATLLASVGPWVHGDANDLVFGTSTGNKIGTATNEKIAFHNAAPVIQRAGAAQAAVVTTAATQTTPWGFATQAQADGIVTLVNEIRAALVEKGLIKGAA
jgi:hypothetical protein